MKYKDSSMKESYTYFIIIAIGSLTISHGFTSILKRSILTNIPAPPHPSWTHHDSFQSQTHVHSSTIQIQEDDTFLTKTLNTQDIRDLSLKQGDEDTNGEDQNEPEELMTCRIAASADGKLTIKEDPSSCTPSDLLMRRQIDQIYNAKFYTLFKLLSLNIHKDVEQQQQEEEEEEEEHANVGESPMPTNMTEQAHALRKCLEQSGFRLCAKRDLDLCEALNEGYLLRLSIQPDLQDLDPNLGRELYPELYQLNSTVQQPDKHLLFDGKILIFTRGYSQEITRGRLLLPKLDYLQSSLVQRSAFSIARRLGDAESEILQRMKQWMNKGWEALKGYVNKMNAKIPSQAQTLVEKGVELIESVGKNDKDTSRRKPSLKLERYVGSSAKYVDSPDDYDALNPFLVCELEDKLTRSMPKDEEEMIIIRDLLKGYDSGELKCKYDIQKPNSEPMHLLKRVSISNLVDFFSTGGRRRLIQSLFSISELIEPTYEEVCILWRPLPNKTSKPKKAFRPPNIVYYLAELFDLVDQLPKNDMVEESKLDPQSIEMRTFDRVPMANLQAVFPKSKLIFRPADALILDAVNTFSLLAVLLSQRFDSPRLDIIAFVSVSLWVVRTFFRYSNKIARYDLLINKFLTSKISHRNRGALQYIVNEAAMQRSQRASLVHEWLKEKYDTNHLVVPRNNILLVGQKELNDRLRIDQPVNIDVNAALVDLTDLNLITFNENDELVDIRTGSQATEALNAIWNECFEVEG